jgi:hypothetical protein
MPAFEENTDPIISWAELQTASDSQLAVGLTSQQGSVDWFCSWLKSEEDHDPQKLEQYDRWRLTREQQAKTN